MNRRLIIAASITLMGILCFVILRFVRTDELNQAAKAGDTESVKRILKTGGAINGSGMHGLTPLMSACAGGNLDTVQYLIDQGANVNGHNDSGSALMWAIESGNLEIVELLIENDVDVKWKNAIGNDASSFAREKGDVRMIELLQ